MRAYIEEIEASAVDIDQNLTRSSRRLWYAVGHGYLGWVSKLRNDESTHKDKFPVVWDEG